jgi:hypothetical protein
MGDESSHIAVQLRGVRRAAAPRSRGAVESVDAAFEPAGAAGPTHEYLDDDDAAYADALYYWGPVAEAFTTGGR